MSLLACAAEASLSSLRTSSKVAAGRSQGVRRAWKTLAASGGMPRSPWRAFSQCRLQKLPQDPLQTIDLASHNLRSSHACKLMPPNLQRLARAAACARCNGQNASMQ